MAESHPSKRSLAVFESYKEAINRALKVYLHELPSTLDATNLPLIGRQALALIAEFTLRPGKRVRGALAALAYDTLTNQKISPAGLRLAVVMELLQSYILIIDDVTDRSDLRRGEPTVHRRYEALYGKTLGVREAEQLAFYTGMIAGHIANLALLDIDETAEHRAHALHSIHRNITTTGFGQLDDIMQEISRNATAVDIIDKYALKTSHYTFINPLHAGMALAGITDTIAYDAVAAFGKAAGIAFQAHDDYLGVFGGTATGKPTVDDVREGKLTILVQHALESGQPDDVQVLKQYLGDPKLTEGDMVKVRALFDATGATIKARQVAESYAQQAIQQLATITIWDEAFNGLLAELVTYTIRRES